MRHAHVASGGRYPVLRTIAILYVVGAIVTAIGGVVVAGWFLLRGDPYNWAGGGAAGRFWLVVGILTATFFSVLLTLAIAEVIKLMIDIEHNTRMAAAGQTVGTANPGGDLSGKTRTQWMEGEETAEGALIRGH